MSTIVLFHLETRRARARKKRSQHACVTPRQETALADPGRCSRQVKALMLRRAWRIRPCTRSRLAVRTPAHASAVAASVMHAKQALLQACTLQRDNAACRSRSAARRYSSTRTALANSAGDRSRRSRYQGRLRKAGNDSSGSVRCRRRTWVGLSKMRSTRAFPALGRRGCRAVSGCRIDRRIGVASCSDSPSTKGLNSHGQFLRPLCCAPLFRRRTRSGEGHGAQHPTHARRSASPHPRLRRDLSRKAGEVTPLATATVLRSHPQR
jgi:hypothetical protein